jgi:hypothetical protein
VGAPQARSFVTGEKSSLRSPHPQPLPGIREGRLSVLGPPLGDVAGDIPLHHGQRT